MYNTNHKQKTLVFGTEFEGPITPEITKASEGIEHVQLSDFYDDVISSYKRFADSVKVIDYGHAYTVKPHENYIMVNCSRFNLLVTPKLYEILTNFRSVYFSDQFNNPVDNLPSNILNLYFDNDFNQPVNCLPDLIQTLMLKKNFNQSIDKLPENLKKLIITSDYFNKPLDNLPKGLIHLEISNNFNQPIDCLPSNLLKLKIGFNFNQPIDNLPKSLTHLSIGNSFDQPVSNWPTNLICLRLGQTFNQPIDNLPHKIIKLFLGYEFDHSLDNLPVNLECLLIGPLFSDYMSDFSGINTDSEKHVYTFDNLPTNLKYLAYHSDRIIRINKLPDNLEKFLCYDNVENIDELEEKYEINIINTFPNNLTSNYTNPFSIRNWFC